MKVIMCDIIWCCVLVLSSGAAGYVLFKRCGEKGWKSFVPFYSTYIYYSLVWDVLPFKIYLGCIPLLLLTAYSVPASLYCLELCVLIIVTMAALHGCFCYKQARYFGRGVLFAAGLFLCDPAFKILLAVWPDGKREAMSRKILRAAGVLISCALVIGCTAITPWSQGWGTLRVNALTFPDSYFRESVTKKMADLECESDMLLTREDIKEFTNIWFMFGVPQRLYLFPELRSFGGMDFALEASTIDTSGNPKLEELSFSESAISSLDLSNNPELITLKCTENALTSLDVSHNTKLEEIWCAQNAIDSLDVSACGKLNWLDCSKNDLSSLDVSQNTVLEALDCSWNELESLDISANEKLLSLWCTGNKLSELDVSANSGLVRLLCDQNELTVLDVSANPELNMLDCTGNDLDTIDVTMNPELTLLDCGENDLTELDVSNNPELTTLTCNDNRIRTLDFGANKLLETADCSGNDLVGLSANGAEALSSLDVSGNPNLMELDVSGNPNLMELDVRGAALRDLDVSGCDNIRTFYGDGQHITVELSYDRNSQTLRGRAGLGEGAVVRGKNIDYEDDIIILNEFTGQTAKYIVPVVDWADMETGEGCISGTITFVVEE